METFKWKFTKSRNTGNYLIYHPCKSNVKIVKTRKEALILRNRLNLNDDINVGEENNGN